MWDTGKRGWNPVAKWKGWSLIEARTLHVLGRKTESEGKIQVRG